MLDKTSELHAKTFTPGGGQAGWTRGFELRQLGVNYRGSPIVVDETPVKGEEAVDPYRSGDDGTVRGGDRAPTPPVSFPSMTPSAKQAFSTFLDPRITQHSSSPKTTPRFWML